MNQQIYKDIPKDIVNQAIDWVVHFKFGLVTEKDKKLLSNWRKEDPLHDKAWQRLNELDQDFAVVSNKDQALINRVLNSSQNKVNGKVLKVISILFVSLVLTWTVIDKPNFGYFLADYKTQTGEIRLVKLENGTVVHINSNSVLDVISIDNKTRMHLYKGQILVDSSASSLENKPYISTTQLNLKPIGTRFVVTQNKDLSNVEILDGSVEAQHRNNSNKLIARAGQKWTVIDQELIRVKPNGLNPEAWVNYMIEADNARLEDVLIAIDRHRAGWLQYSSEVEDIRVSGNFHLHDTDSILGALEKTLPITINKTTKWWVEVEKK